MKKVNIPFNKPSLIGNELKYIKEALARGKISGDGFFTKKCQAFIEKKFGVKKALLTTSCTHALELAAILLDLKPGDEIILPSFTFTSTANAFVLRGAIPIFVDIRNDTLNIDENKIEEKITKKTKAIVIVHYAGIACQMDKIMQIAKKHNLYLIEDAAQAIGAKYKNKYLGTIGTIGAYSFHETKNIYCGEGGVILLNDDTYIERAEIIREKGTNRSKFLRGKINKYHWVDIGSSYVMSDQLAAFLYGQLEKTRSINLIRKKLYDTYFNNLLELKNKEYLQLPFIPSYATPNYHTFYIILNSSETREHLRMYLIKKGILAISHYIPLHISPMGKKYGYKKGDLPFTENLSEKILRFPLYYSLQKMEQTYILNSIHKFFKL